MTAKDKSPPWASGRFQFQVHEAYNQNNKDKSVRKQMRRIVTAENTQINNPLIRYVINK